jgi:hypothetical protein
MPRIERHPARTVAVSAAAMLLTGALTALGVHQFGAGIDFTASSDAITAPQVSGLTAMTLRDTPAETALSRALGDVPDGWNAEGDVQRSQAAPSPYSCPLPGKAPSTSMTRSFRAAGATVRVTTAAYTAGLGAEAMAEANSRAFVCAGQDGPVGWDKMYGDTPGTESYLASVTKAGTVLWTASFRRGDVITYLTGAGPSTLQSLALGFDKHLSGFLDKVCANTGSGTGDATRSLWATAAYKPFTVGTEVSVDNPGLPKPAAGAKAVSLPGPDLDVEEVTPHGTPDHPVWPKMPAPVKRPAAPASPPEAPVTSRTVQMLSADTTGPGCGWSFTGTAAPVFDTAAASASNAALQGKTAARLTAGTELWSASVLAYWKAYEAYRKGAEAYAKYAGEVRTVNAAWDDIEAAWDDYNARKATYEAAVQDRARFAAEKSEAQKSYIADLERCAAEASRPTPAPTASPEPSASPSPKPTGDPEAAGKCSVSRPEILDKTAPELPEKPTEPADPRPADARG